MMWRQVCLSVALAACAVASADGPDVAVGELYQVTHWTNTGAVSENGVPYRAYSVGTISCNIGNQQLDWVETTNQHPVIATNMYRLKDGRLEQIGMSWLKHGFCALQQSLCSSCQPAGQGCISKLGIGCSDPYDGALNGNQFRLGPRWQVNASTGFFPYPFDTINDAGNAIYKRLRVRESDLTPALNTGALYFVEGQYVHPDDAAAGNGSNNASYRRATVNASYSVTAQGNTEFTKPAINAWRDHGGGLNTPDPNVVVFPIDVPSDGRFWVGYRVQANGNGTYRYTYAVQNISSDRAGGSLSVPISTGTVVSALGFVDCFYHSGEPFDNTDWTVQVGATSVSWNSPATFDVDPLSNALRFGTLYSFWFDSATPPGAGTVTLGLFKPGAPSSVGFTALVPGGDVPCPADIDGDGMTGQGDLNLVLASFNLCPGDAGYIPGAGLLDPLDPCCNQNDLNIVLANFGCQ